MPEEYNRAILKVGIAQICQMIGWHSINSTPLEFLVDLMQEYLLRITKVTKQYAEVLGRTEANLDDLGLAFQHMHVQIPELSAYVRNVDSISCIIAVPQFPVHRENHLNFLKPGSQEVVTRPVHIHEHLPAMYPNTEEVCFVDKEEAPDCCETDSGSGNAVPPEASMAISPNQLPQSVFKRPGAMLPSENSTAAKRSKIIEEGRPLREIHSVIMTTSGFLSPAREGKLPEPRTPHPARADSPPASLYPMVPPELKLEKKPKKIVKKGLEDRKLDKENKKKNRVKELFKPDNISDIRAKKLTGTKEHTKLKPSKSGCSKGHASSPGSSNRPATPQLSAHKEIPAKTPKIPQSRIKPEKAPDLTSTAAPSDQKEDTIDKLPSEPDKQKLNIFKKISKSREEKSTDGPELPKYKELDSRESSPGLVIDDLSDKYAQRTDIEIKREEKKTPKTPEVHIDAGGELTDIKSPSPDVYIFGDISPPGTPSTPKTPELQVPVPIDLKKKKKERNVRKKEVRSKSPKRSISPKKGKNVVDVQEAQLCDRPKTPQAVEAEVYKETSNPPTLPFPFFPPFPSAPGLIPHPIGHPIFPRYPLALGRNVPGAHPAMPNLPMPPRFLTSNIRPSDSLPPKTKISEREKISTPLLDDILPTHLEPEKFLKPAVDKVGRSMKLEKEVPQPAIAPTTVLNDSIVSPVSLTNVPSVPTPSRLTTKNEKLDKNNKKSKIHKKERKDKFKKKKDKKEKHKIKEKSKGKKGKLTKLKDKKDKKDKRKDKEKEDKTAEAVPKITLKLGPASPRPPTPDNSTMKKITIKPLIKKPEEDKRRDPSPELAKISALVTRPPKQKLTKSKTDVAPKKDDGIDEKDNGKDVLAVQPAGVDQTSRQVWICPACGNQDDGSPMIGCDDCDAWYHWVCVGVQVPPADHEDWYCRLCIAKKQELHHDKKKKKRKKKVKAAA